MAKTILQERLKTLYNKCKLIASTSLAHIAKYDYESFSGWITTAYGNRGFIIRPNGSFSYVDVDENVNGPNREPLFKIHFYWGGYVHIEPIVDMTGHEIDMAIYEIEQEVEESYKKACKREAYSFCGFHQ